MVLFEFDPPATGNGPFHGLEHAGNSTGTPGAVIKSEHQRTNAKNKNNGEWLPSIPRANIKTPT
jgi:hypothetical protein